MPDDVGVDVDAVAQPAVPQEARRQAREIPRPGPNVEERHARFQLQVLQHRHVHVGGADVHVGFLERPVSVRFQSVVLRHEIAPVRHPKRVQNLRPLLQHPVHHHLVD